MSDPCTRLSIVTFSAGRTQTVPTSASPWCRGLVGKAAWQLLNKGLAFPAFCMLQLSLPLLVTTWRSGLKVWKTCVYNSFPFFFTNVDVWFHPSCIHVFFVYAGRRGSALFHHSQIQRESFCLQQAGQTPGEHAAASGFRQGGWECLDVRAASYQGPRLVV